MGIGRQSVYREGRYAVWGGGRYRPFMVTSPPATTIDASTNIDIKNNSNTRSTDTDNTNINNTNATTNYH